MTVDIKERRRRTFSSNSKEIITASGQSAQPNGLALSSTSRRTRKTAGPRAKQASRKPALPAASQSVPFGAGTHLLAVLDIGSHALRMAVGEIGSDPTVRPLETFNVPMALGLDTFSTGRIRSVTTEAVVNTIQDFLASLRSYQIGPERCRVVATTAVRDARNRDVFIDRVEQSCGLHIEVIEAIEELRLTYQFLRYLLGARLERGTCLLLSLGGGGTQIVVQRDGEILFGETHRFGLLQLWGTHPTEQVAILAARSFLAKKVRSIERLHGLKEINTLVVSNKELSLLLNQMSRVSHSEVGIEIRRRELLRLYTTLDQLTTEELLSNTDLDYPTAEMARMALEELKIFSDFTSTEAILVTSVSLLDCLFFDAQLRLEGGAGNDLRTQQIESAACALGRKYHFDEAHALHVRLLSLQLFDALLQLTHLSLRSRLLLGVAAILHDIGYFVSSHDHEQHSRYLIATSEIIGLGRQDLERIALITRYHRRPFAEIDQVELNRFPSGDRVELLKLASLLRLADALDVDYQQRIERVEVNLTPDLLQLYAVTRTGDREAFSSIDQTFRAKADLFGEMFGIEPVLTELLAR